MQIAITMTATLRPSILTQTLSSFYSNCFNGDEYLFINIDPVGLYGSGLELGIEAAIIEIQDRIEEYFPMNKIVGRTPIVPSFPEAFKWLWNRVLDYDFKYIFHLEDDWKLIRGVDLSHMISLMEKYPELLILRLSQFPTGDTKSKNWNKFIYWTGEFFEPVPSEKGLLGFCGHPSLIKREFVEAAVRVLDDTHNPEKALKGHNSIMKPLYEKGRFGVYSPQNVGPTVIDIGRPWMLKNGFRKAGDKANFTHWNKV